MSRSDRQVPLSCWFSLCVSDTSRHFNLACPSGLRLLWMQFCPFLSDSFYEINPRPLHKHLFFISFVLILSKLHFLSPNPKPTFTQTFLDFYRGIIYLFIKLFFSWGKRGFYNKTWVSYFKYLYYMWLWTTKPVISSTGIFVAIANNTLHRSK